MLVSTIFSFCHNVFYPSENEFHFLATFILSSAIAFNLDLSKIVSFATDLSIIQAAFLAELPPVSKLKYSFSYENVVRNTRQSACCE